MAKTKESLQAVPFVPGCPLRPDVIEAENGENEGVTSACPLRSEYNQQELYWVGEHFVVTASRYGSTPDDGVFMIYQAKEVTDNAKRDLEIRKKALQ